MIDFSEFNKGKRIHFIGIGGCNISGLALLLKSNGYKVSGSDLVNSKRVQDLKNEGIKVCLNHSKDNIDNEIGLIVYTVAVPKDNPELKEGEMRGIKIIDRGELLGSIMHFSPNRIAVAGTHGKTTTTAMIASMMDSPEFNPSISIGENLPFKNKNFHLGNSKYFLAEACEYYDSFLHFFPTVGVVLNIKDEHPDYFKDETQLLSSFEKFIENVNDVKGLKIICNDDPNSKQLIKKDVNDMITFGLEEDSDYRAFDIFWNKGIASFSVKFRNKVMTNIQLNVPGVHNIYNALAAIAVCDQLLVPIHEIRMGLKKYLGVNRRLEFKGNLGELQIFDDLACHPNEIAATMEGLRKISESKKIYVILQPNSFSRVKAYKDLYQYCFLKNEEILLLDIFPGRDKEDFNLHSLDLEKILKQADLNANYYSDVSDVISYLATKTDEKSVAITVGPIGMDKVSEMLINGKGN